MFSDQVALELVKQAIAQYGEAHQYDVAELGQRQGIFLSTEKIDTLVPNQIRPALDRLAESGLIKLKPWCRNTFILTSAEKEIK